MLRPDPNDGRFDDIDDEDPMAVVSSTEPESSGASGTAVTITSDDISKHPPPEEEEEPAEPLFEFTTRMLGFISQRFGSPELPKKSRIELQSTSKVTEQETKQKVFAYEKVPGTSQDPPTEKFKQPKKVSEIEPTYMSRSTDRFLAGLKLGHGKYERGYFEKVKSWQPPEVKQEGFTRFVCISDTHESHREIDVPPGDVLLHCGDFTEYGELEQVDDFNDWLGELPHKYKIVIAGNHELSFDPSIMERVKRAKETGSSIRWGKYLMPIPEEVWRNWRSRLANCVYLEDQEVQINGIRIYGSPWQPEIGRLAFNLPRGREILQKWNKIPGDGIDILMTHGPPVGHGDRVIQLMARENSHVGCVDLLNTVQMRVQPKYHLFGHIHEDYGITTDQFTIYGNCSVVNFHLDVANEPFVFDLPNRPAKKEFVGPISY